MSRIPELMTAPEVAAALKVCLKTVQRWTNSGEIPVRIDRPGCRRYVLEEVLHALEVRSGGPAKTVGQLQEELAAERKAKRQGRKEVAR